MIVVGINVALWFEGWFQDLQDAEIAVRYLEDLRTDLETDIRSLDVAIASNDEKSERVAAIIERLPTIAEMSPEEQAQAIYTPSNYYFFEPSDFTYRSMQESGDFRLLSDAAIKEGILRLVRHYRMIDTLQQNFLQALDDEYIPLLMNHFDLVANRIAEPGVLDSLIFQNFFAYALQDTAGRVEACKRARTQARTLLSDIEAQLGRR